MRLRDKPRVCCKALLELRDLLDETVYTPPSLEVEDQHVSLKPKGGADERSESISATGATSVLPGTPSPSVLESSSEGGQAIGDSTGSEDAAGVSSAPNFSKGAAGDKQ